MRWAGGVEAGSSVAEIGRCRWGWQERQQCGRCISSSRVMHG